MASLIAALPAADVLASGWQSTAEIRMTSGSEPGAGAALPAGEPQDAPEEENPESGEAENAGADQPEELQETGNFGEGAQSGGQPDTAEKNDPSADSMKGSGNAEGTPAGYAPADGVTEDAAPEEEASQKDDTEVKGTIVNGADAPADGVEKTDEPSVEGSIIADENNDDVVIGENDRPYLALGADLSDAQRQKVLSIMGIDAAGLSGYDVVYVTNAEEHQFLDAYIASSRIGSRALSSVVIVKREKGSGLNISTTNITYCTVGMYKNALTTAGVKDADIIVAGPTGISGTAALVGIFKAYQEITGEVIDDSIVDVALNEIVVTGQLEESMEGLTDREVEEFVAYIKSVIAEKDLSDEAEINEVIDEACKKYNVTLNEGERRQIVDLLLKITSLGIDLDGLADYAKTLYDSFKNEGGGGSGIFAKIVDAIADMFSSIGDFFRSLFS